MSKHAAELAAGRKAVELLRSLMTASFYISAIELDQCSDLDGEEFGQQAEAVIAEFDAAEHKTLTP